MQELQNKYLNQALKIELPSPKTFRYKILPKVKDSLEIFLDSKLKNASAITIICDNWSDNSMRSYLALAVFSVDKLFLKIFFILGIEEVKGKHGAENLQEAILAILSKFRFDKNLIKSVVTDEGSNFLRLFRTDLLIDEKDNNETDILENQNYENNESSNIELINASDKEVQETANEANDQSFLNPLETRKSTHHHES